MTPGTMEHQAVVEVDGADFETVGYTEIHYMASDPTPEQQMRMVQISGTLDFWNRPEEDIYTTEDGEPV